MALIQGVISAVIGLIIGIVACGDTVSPRWFWVRSQAELAGSRIMSALGYAVQFFFLIHADIIDLFEYLG